MSVYAWVLFLSLIGPLAFSFNQRVSYYTKWVPLFAGILINGILFISWDSWFVRSGVWGFNPEYVWSIRVMNLPVEEWLFFLVIPFCSLFIYECLKYYVKTEPFKNTKQHITLFFFVFTFLMAISNMSRLYTFYNCLMASLLLLIHLLFLKRSWMGSFWLAYFVHLIPFLLVDGILTGMATQRPIVWYNHAENLGLRIFTIPIEDTIYALTCLLIPITTMEWIIDRKKYRHVKELS